MREFDASYLLRVWRDGRGEEAWRASLRDLRSQETTTFRTLDELTAHIAQLGVSGESGGGGRTDAQSD